MPPPAAPPDEDEEDEQLCRYCFEGSEAGSRLLVRGAFEINELEMDRWGYDILEDVKREENGTPYCGGAAAPQ